MYFYNYLRDPQSNAYVERLSRTLHKHFIEWYSDNLIEPEKFNVNLIYYLLFYIIKKTPKSLNNFSPIYYFLKTYIKDPYQSEMVRNYTLIYRRRQIEFNPTFFRIYFITTLSSFISSFL